MSQRPVMGMKLIDWISSVLYDLNVFSVSKKTQILIALILLKLQKTFSEHVMLS